MTYKYNPFTHKLDLVGSGTGGGDVNGPGSSTDNAVVRWDGVSGTLIQNSVAILSDAGDLSVNSIDLTIALAATDGGTGQTSYTTGDLLYASSSSALSKLPIGTNSQVLTLSGGLPSWQTPAASGVTSVSGTTDRITSTGGTTPVIDIAATYVGQTSITTLGTIATGTWNGTAVGPTFGGTGLTSYSTNDVIYASATNTLSKLSIAGIPGSHLIYDGANLVAYNPTKHTILFDEFTSGVNFGNLGWALSASGLGNTTIFTAGTSTNPGISALNIGLGAAAQGIRLGSSSVAPSLLLGAGTYYLHFICRPTALSDATDSYIVRIGLLSGAATLNPQTDAVFFEYTHGTNSGKWTINCVSASTPTTQNTNDTADTNFHKFSIKINSNASSVNFYIDDVEVSNSPITTNIPTTNNVAFALQILRTAGSSNVRSLYVDQFYAFINLNSAR